MKPHATPAPKAAGGEAAGAAGGTASAGGGELPNGESPATQELGAMEVEAAGEGSGEVRMAK